MYTFGIGIVICGILLMILFMMQGRIRNKEAAKSHQIIVEKQKKAEQQRIANKKGELGEYKINFQFESLPEEYKHLADVLIQSARGLTQIDHIVVSPYGIFVVETKNFAGWIFGNQQDKYWTQTFYNKKNKFYNPVRQNYGHIRALKELLKDYKNLKFHSIIAFTRRCELREIKIDSDITVIYDTEISNVILRRNKEVVLSNSEVVNIYNIIREANITDKNLRAEHIKQIKRKVQF